MQRKVFITVLGTGFYGKCQYSYGDFTSSPTRFIQLATMEWIGAKEWSADDVAYIFVTQKARTSNWMVENNKKLSPKGNIEDYVCLREELACFPCGVEPVDIPDGKDEQEIWQIFQIVLSKLLDNDKIYMDFTHGFRYLPMLLLVLGNYAKFLLSNIQVMSMSYGNFEARDPKTNICPFVSLLPLAALQDWAIAAADYKLNGFVDRLANMSNGDLKPLLRDDEKRTEDAKALNQLIKRLEEWCKERLYCRGMNVINAETQKKITRYLAKVSNVVIAPLHPLLGHFRETINTEVRQNDVANMFDAARWCFEHKQYQQSVTFLEEGVVSFFSQRHSIALNDRKKRGLITKAVNYQYKVFHDKSTEDFIIAPEDKHLFDKIIKDPLLDDKELVEQISALIDFRNDYNHCGMNESPTSPNRFLTISERLYENIFSRLFNASPFIPPRPSLFINLSNHPVEKWSPIQHDAAAAYGRVMDIPFPPIQPDATTDDIHEQADEYVKKILEINSSHDVIVHIMGEMTFTYSVVERLKALGIRCVASTTKRNVTEQNGQKTSTFEFVQFRDY